MTAEELAASKAIAQTKRRLRMLWGGDSTTAEICEELGVTIQEMESLAGQMALGERAIRAYLPSAADIRRECAQFRAGWSREELESRIVGPRRGRM